MRQILVSYVQQSHIPRPGTKIKTYYCSISVFFEQTKIPEKGEKGEEKEEEGKEEEEEEGVRFQVSSVETGRGPIGARIIRLLCFVVTRRTGDSGQLHKETWTDMKAL